MRANDLLVLGFWGIIHPSIWIDTGHVGIQVSGRNSTFLAQLGLGWGEVAGSTHWIQVETNSWERRL